MQQPKARAAVVANAISASKRGATVSFSAETIAQVRNVIRKLADDASNTPQIKTPGLQRSADGILEVYAALQAHAFADADIDAALQVSEPPHFPPLPLPIPRNPSSPLSS